MKFLRCLVVGVALSASALAQVASAPANQSLAVGGDGQPTVGCTSGGTCTAQTSNLYNLTLQAGGTKTATLDTGGAGTVAVAGANAATATVGNTANTATVTVQGTAAAAYTVGTAAHTGTLTLGNSTAGDTVNVSNASAATGTNNIVNIGATAATGTGTEQVTLGSQVANARNGLRIATARVITSSRPTTPPDCAGATLNLTVTQFLEAGIATCATAQTIAMPTWQGASGTVQNLPGTPAIGDIVEFTMVATAANALTPTFGTGGTNGGGTATVAANTTRHFWCRITGITSGSETATCY